MSQDKRHRITVYAQTDVGMVRAGNEDTFLVLNLDTSDTWTPVTVEGDPPENLASFEQASAGTILAVSDGMGGALAGEVASRMAVEGVRDHMLFFKSNATFSAFPFHERLRLAVEQANSQINNESMGNADYAGMGATFTAAGVHDGFLTLAQIGDSRCYLIRGNRIALVTHDQSLVWQLVEAGHITEEEAETHQYKNVILQALGAQPRVNVVVDRIAVHDGDTVLLCSDGLSGRVRSEEMLDIVTKATSLRASCEQLIQLANDRGGEDNITVIVARFEGEMLPPAGELTSERVERDPNLPYDVDEELVGDAEPTLSPDQLDEAHPMGSDEGPATGFSAKVTNRLSSTPPNETPSTSTRSWPRASSIRRTVAARPGIRRGIRYAVEPPVPGTSTVMVRTCRGSKRSSKGPHIPRFPPIPVSSSSGRPVPRIPTRRRAPSTSISRTERADTGDVPSDDEGLDRLGALVRVDRLHVGQVPHDVEVEQDPVAAE